MSVPAGWAEFNDANAFIRGRMVGGSGTFSGTFAADIIDAVDTINIRDGAVSAHYGFSVAPGGQTATFTIPAQPHASFVDIIVPIVVETMGANYELMRIEGRVEIYRNGVLIDSDLVYMPGRVAISNTSDYDIYYFSAPQVVRYIDFEVNAGASTQYTVKLFDGADQYGKLSLYDLETSRWAGSISMYDEYGGYTHPTLIGTIVASCRKR